MSASRLQHDAATVVSPSGFRGARGAILTELKRVSSTARELAVRLGVSLNGVRHHLRELEAAGLEVLLDDRLTSPGVAFKDAELLGTPTILVVGKGLATGEVELRDRRSGEARAVPLADAVTAVVAEVLGDGWDIPSDSLRPVGTAIIQVLTVASAVVEVAALRIWVADGEAPVDFAHYLVLPRDRPISPGARAFADWLKREAGDHENNMGQL